MELSLTESGNISETNMEQIPPTDNLNADELVAPAWLNSLFLEDVLRQYEQAPELKVGDVKITPASAKGDHYASIMFRANVSYSTQNSPHSRKSLIIKTMPEQEGHKKDLLGGTHIFETEIGMYTKVLPRFEGILREAGDQTRLFVPCLYSALEPHQLMIFEDLVQQGYEVIRRRDPTIEEVQLALLKLAKWHAVSFHLLHEQPEFLEEFKYGFFEIPNIREDPFFGNGMRKFLHFLGEVPELSKYIPYFKKLQNDYIDHMEVVMHEYHKHRQPNGYYVLCHGDFHIKNMMFKRRPNGSAEEVMLLDFQISNICPITVDLIYSIYMLMGPEERKSRSKELIEYYFAEFLGTLQRIGYKGQLPSFEQLWKQMAQHWCYDIYLITTFLPMMTALKSCNFDIADIIHGEDAQKETYRLELYVKDVKHLLASFEAEGFFEELN